MVEGVLGQLRHMQTVLDDLDGSLKVTVCFSGIVEVLVAACSTSSICM
jgi:hypothetical protein